MVTHIQQNIGASMAPYKKRRDTQEVAHRREELGRNISSL